MTCPADWIGKSEAAALLGVKPSSLKCALRRDPLAPDDRRVVTDERGRHLELRRAAVEAVARARAERRAARSSRHERVAPVANPARPRRAPKPRRLTPLERRVQRVAAAAERAGSRDFSAPVARDDLVGYELCDRADPDAVRLGGRTFVRPPRLTSMPAPPAADPGHAIVPGGGRSDS